jgi:hypothetical protein
MTPNLTSEVMVDIVGEDMNEHRRSAWYAPDTVIANELVSPDDCATRRSLTIKFTLHPTASQIILGIGNAQ